MSSKNLFLLVKVHLRVLVSSVQVQVKLQTKVLVRFEVIFVVRCRQG